MTLYEDFKYWWNLPKYKTHEFPAKEHAQKQILKRHGSGQGWPGDEPVSYWVELEQGVSVGFFHGKTPTGRYKKYAEFPVHITSESS